MAGRPKGSRNKLTPDIKNAALIAAEKYADKHAPEPQYQGTAMVRFFLKAAEDHPKEFLTQVVGRMIPKDHNVQAELTKTEHRVTEIIYTPKMVDKREIIDVEAKELEHSPVSDET